MKEFEVTYETDTGPEVTFIFKAVDKQDIISQHYCLEHPWPIISIKEIKS